ncbi:(Fe-S)-binding protein [Chitinimonas koreensis]|uniref:(Fe-S)-binding protein n=1 Tax=Chitinimonas koreensis TaxID=356302 RepID=UPI0003FA40D0|nr:(Fe-S)-binding protein [Chitinimonas koreensis]QNM95845.1 (Fe-S)-binding protein [Chitinimonas koreensis]
MRVGLYASCLADLLRPGVAMAALELLEAAGCEVVVPEQSCCGQPAYNGGERALARRLAIQAIERFEDCDYVVLPSGSCAGMMRRHYGALLAGGDLAPGRVDAFAAKVHELADFLVTVLDYRPAARLAATASYHDGCAGLRELGVKAQPRALLAQVEGLELREMAEAEQCCGFGGSFAAKYPEISCAIADKKCAALAATGADTLIAGDLGCLLHLEGRLRARGDKRTRLVHFAEVLTGRAER